MGLFPDKKRFLLLGATWALRKEAVKLGRTPDKADIQLVQRTFLHFIQQKPFQSKL